MTQVPHRVLALETSSTRGSVALIESTAAGISVAGYAFHEHANQHAERLLGLVDEALRSAGWEKGSLDRVAVGVGPGSFTGVRVALSLGQGLMLGLGIPGVGVGSLRAVAAGYPQDEQKLRVVVRDARRDEYFIAAYRSNGQEVVAPYAIPQEGAAAVLNEKFADEDFVVLGTELDGVPCAESEETVAPDARAVGRVALSLTPEEAPVAPQYVRGPNIVRPNLPVSPLSQERS